MRGLKGRCNELLAHFVALGDFLAKLTHFGAGGPLEVGVFDQQHGHVVHRTRPMINFFVGIAVCATHMGVPGATMNRAIFGFFACSPEWAKCFYFKAHAQSFTQMIASTYWTLMPREWVWEPPPPAAVTGDLPFALKPDNSPP